MIWSNGTVGSMATGKHSSFRMLIMPKPLDDPIFDDLFLGCALIAYVELAVQCGDVPDQETTRQLADRFYEEELAKRCFQDASIGSARPSPS